MSHAEAAEAAAAYVVERVAASAGSRCLQGRRKAPLGEMRPGSRLALVSTTRLRGLGEPVAHALVAWAEGRRRVRLLEHVPRATEVLAWQATGERCVSLLADGVPTSPHADGLAFAVHDLCHLEKFNDPDHHAGQVGFFGAVDDAMRSAAWATFSARFDADFDRDLTHVIADMNGSAIFLFAALKMKLKMAVRRNVAKERGPSVAVRVEGALDAGEQAAFDGELSVLLDLLSMSGKARDAGHAVSTRRDAHDASVVLLAYFESLGAARLAAAAR